MDLLSIKPAVTSVEVPGGTVHVRQFSAGDRAKLLTIGKDIEETGNHTAFLVHTVILAVCDQDGRRLYQEADYDRLAEHVPAPVLDAIAEAALRVNGMTKDAVEDAKKN